MGDAKRQQRGRRSSSGFLRASASLLHTHPYWVVAYSGVIAPAVGTLLITLGQERKDKGDWAFLMGGFTLLLFGGLLLFLKQWASDVITAIDFKVAQQFRVTVRDALQRLAELIAEMPGQSKAQRECSLEIVATQAVGSLTLLLKDVDRLRANVFKVTDSGDLECIAYHGRGDGVKPEKFDKGTTRGKRALKFVRTASRPLFVPDVEEARKAGLDYAGTESGYDAFISASIHTDDLAFGMVTVDAPRVGSLVETDKYAVGVLADLLAIAFAMAEYNWTDRWSKMWEKVKPQARPTGNDDADDGDDDAPPNAQSQATRPHT